MTQKKCNKIIPVLFASFTLFIYNFVQVDCYLDSRRKGEGTFLQMKLANISVDFIRDVM